MPNRRRPRRRPHAFTLAELLVVIGIIGLLAAISVPIIGRVRRAAMVTNTKAFVSQLDQACRRYKQDQLAYPGPLSNTQVYNDAFGGPLAITGGTVTGTNVTMAENLVLGLSGGLRPSSPFSAATPVQFTREDVGRGASSLTPLQPKRYTAYVDLPDALSAGDAANGGRFADASGNLANDSSVPEFLDRFSEPLPILYLRAGNAGGNDGNGTPGPGSSANNPVVTRGVAPGVAAYQLEQITPYIGSTIGVGLLDDDADTTPSHGITEIEYYPTSNTAFANAPLPKLTSSNVVIPSPGGPAGAPKAFAYLVDRSSNVSPRRARNHDSFILISAGPDRIYGTKDDVTNAGDLP